MKSSQSHNGTQLHCKVCEGSLHAALPAILVLGKHNGELLKCSLCGFEFFSSPEMWLEEAYGAPIANTDTGIVARSLGANRILSSFFGLTIPTGRILDWGSGSGLLVRLLRDDGYDCYGLEPYTTPVLATNQTLKDEEEAITNAPYRAIVAIEVVEHLPNPKVFFAKVLKATNTLIFSTELAESNRDGSKWWYYCPETGQHICFYTAKALTYLAKINGCIYACSQNKSMHIITRDKIDLFLFRCISGRKRSRILYPLAKFINKLRGRSSLLTIDHIAAKQALETAQSSKAE